jgi:hypothetical protein
VSGFSLYHIRPALALPIGKSFRQFSFASQVQTAKMPRPKFHGGDGLQARILYTRFNMRTRFGAALVLLLSGLVAPAYGQVDMRWNFPQGGQFYIEDVQKIKGTLMVQGQTINQEQEQTFISRFTVLSKNADGSVVLERRIESMKVNSNLPTPGMDDLIKQLEGATFKVTVTSAMAVSKIEGVDEYIDRVTKANPMLGQLFRAMFSEDTLKAALDEAFGCLANKTVKPGDKWTHKGAIPMGPMGTIVGDNTYVYDGPQDGLHKVTVKGTLTYKMPQAGAGGLPFQVTKADLKADEARGTIYYDAAKSRPARTEMKVHMKMTMTATAMGQNIDLTMDQDVTVQSRLLDKKP